MPRILVTPHEEWERTCNTRFNWAERMFAQGRCTGLTKAAETCRDVLDPDKSTDEKAERLARFFQPTLIHINFDKPIPVELSAGLGFEGNGHDRERAELLDVVDSACADLLGS